MSAARGQIPNERSVTPPSSSAVVASWMAKDSTFPSRQASSRASIQALASVSVVGTAATAHSR
jgi:hypothetical protein